MTISRMNSRPFEPGDLVVCLDGEGIRAPGLVLDCRVSPHAYRDSACTVPAYEVDVLFGLLNPFLQTVRSVVGAETNVITVSDTVIHLA